MLGSGRDLLTDFLAVPRRTLMRGLPDRQHDVESTWAARHPASKWLVVLLTLLVGGSFLPLRWKVRIGAHGPYHLPAHFAVFFLCGLVAFLPSSTTLSRVVRVITLIILAVAIEVLQKIAFGDQLELADMRADVGGLLAALVVAELSTRISRTPGQTR